jgi:hypothetical protein
MNVRQTCANDTHTSRTRQAHFLESLCAICPSGPSGGAGFSAKAGGQSSMPSPWACTRSRCSVAEARRHRDSQGKSKGVSACILCAVSGSLRLRVRLAGFTNSFGSAGSGVVAANKTTTDADQNGFDSPEGDANPFPSASVVVSAGMISPNPVDPQFHTDTINSSAIGCIFFTLSPPHPLSLPGAYRAPCAAAPSAASGARGRLTVKRLPWPSVLVKVNSPCSSSTMRWV